MIAQFAPDALEFTLDDLPELNPNPTPAANNRTQYALDAAAQTFINILWRGAPYGFVQNLNAGATFDKRRSVYYQSGEGVNFPSAWINDKSNIFHGVNPTIVRRAYFEASRSADIAALNTLYREYDAKDFTDPSAEEIAACLPIVEQKDAARVADALAQDPNSKVRPASPQALHNQAVDMAEDVKFKANPELYMQMARAYVDALALAPSVIVKSGGGYQCYWLLTDPFIIRTHPDDHAAHVQAYAEDLQKRWVHLDPRADQGVNDLRRILRTPGTYNHKPKYAPNFPKVTFYRKDFDFRYELADLVTMLPAPAVAEVARHGAKSAEDLGTIVPANAPYEGESVITAYNAKHRLADVLTQYGYAYVGRNRYMRPGGQTTAGVELFPNENNARIWSSNDPLYNGAHRCTPFTVMCVYDHNGDIHAAVKAAAAELGMVRERKPETARRLADTIQNARAWLQCAAFAKLIPQHLQSAKGYRTNARDKRLYSGYLDVFAKYGNTRGPISNQQLSLATGLSEGTVRAGTKNLIGADLIRQIEAPQGAGPGAFWYELVYRPEFDISCVGCAVLDITTGELYRATYATDVFTTHKADDAFQRGGSKRQRQMATIKAIGPDGLILLDILNAYGRQTQTAISARTHQSKYTVSRLVKRLEEYEVVTVETEWKQHFVTLKTEWLDVVNELTPHMPTYGLQFKRELNAPARTIDHCDRMLARGMGDQQQIERRREKAAKRYFALLKQEAEQVFDDERSTEVMHRMNAHDAHRRTAKGYTPTRINYAQQYKLDRLHGNARMDLAETRHKTQWENTRLLSENIATLKASNTPKREWYNVLTLAGFTPNEAKQAIKFGGAA